MIKSISYWSFPEGSAARDVLKQAKDLGYEAVELTLEAKGDVTAATSDEELAAIKAYADELGMKVPTMATLLYWESPLIGPGGVQPEAAQEITRHLLRCAKALGAETILTVPCTVGPELHYDVAYDSGVSLYKKMGPMAAEYGVKIGVENVWNKFLTSPLEFARFIDEIDHPNVGAYFDVGNVLLFGFPEQWIRILGKRIVAIHIKDFRTAVGNLDGFVDLLEGDVAWDAVLAALQAIGYDGPVTAEMMPQYKHYQMRLLEATSNAMDSILGR